MNKDEAEVARDNKEAVVDTYTGEVGVIENLKNDGGAMVLYLGARLARLTQIGDLAVVSLRVYNDLNDWELHPAGKVHGGQKGAEGK